MKSFKDYLTESKKVYEFKVKVAGELPDGAMDKIKAALSQFSCASCGKGKSTPIQESHVDFPELSNISVTTFEVSTNYPATSNQIRDAVSNTLQKTLSEIRVRNPQEEKEAEINNQHKEKSDGALLEKDYESSNNQDLVGDKHIGSFLKELSKTRKEPEQYKGVNDELTPSKAPKATKAKKTSEQINNTSPVGSRKVKLPTAKGV